MKFAFGFIAIIFALVSRAGAGQVKYQPVLNKTCDGVSQSLNAEERVSVNGDKLSPYVILAQTDINGCTVAKVHMVAVTGITIADSKQTIEFVTTSTAEKKTSCASQVSQVPAEFISGSYSGSQLILQTPACKQLIMNLGLSN